MIEIYRSSRVETLAELLAEHLHQQRPASVLSRQTLIVGHVGMKHWLVRQLAAMQRVGRSPISANVEMLLPSEWLDGLAQRELGRHSIAIAPYQRTALRWRVHALLPTLDDPQVNQYLTGEDVPRRRFQLADRLAGLFGQYLVYRRDWLAAWEKGRDGDAPHWQNRLWQRLVEDIGQDHRARRMGELMARLPTLAANLEEPALHVFGVSHLPPDALSALSALSQSRTVQIYFPDPCRELWEDLRDKRAVYTASLKGDAFLEIGHPLLAALGRLGQHYALKLNGLDADWDLRDRYDDEAFGLLSREHSLLERLQHSIRSLRPDWVKLPDDADADQRSDSSLRVHSCHTRLRELEVLKDALLEQLAVDDRSAPRTLHPKDIVVMAPNMALYAPLLPVVFGNAGDSRALLPYRLADVSLARMHPLLTAVRELIDLPTQRITRSQVLSLLALPAVSRRFGMHDGQHAALERWLDRAHVAWGLDGPMKADFGAAPVDDHSFAFGLDRIFAGHLLGEVAADVLLDGHILPAAPVTGPDALCAAALWGLLEVLREWRGSAGHSRSLATWSLQLREWVDRLFDVDPRDESEVSALGSVMSLAASLAEQEQDAGIVVSVPWTVVRELMIQGLDSVPERQPFLAGGITFCGMVPQRAIPFQVIALLGLNDGDYPRPRPDTGLDLMQTYPRMGDRDNRSDDRYLFLEALMSARRALHLSYVGEGVQDGKARNPALPLAELLGFLERELGSAEGESKFAAPWRVRHPLQPFDARYFDPTQTDPRMWSYSDVFAQLAAADGVEDWQLLAQSPTALNANVANGPIELASMIRFFKDPAKWICKQALKLSRDALEDAAPSDDEPLEATPHFFDGIRAQLVWEALHSGNAQIPLEAPPAFLRSGQYASGEIGKRSWQIVRDEAQTYLDLVREHAPFSLGRTAPETRAIDLTLDATRVVGHVGQLYRADDAEVLLSLSTSKPTFKQVIPLFIEWACLRLADADRPCRLLMVHRHEKDRLPIVGPPIPFAQEIGQIRAGFSQLMQIYQNAHAHAGIYYARSSFAMAHALHKDPDNDAKARSAAIGSWAGGGYAKSSGERDYAPLYNRITAGNVDFTGADNDASRRFEELARTLLAVITGSARTTEPTS